MFLCRAAGEPPSIRRVAALIKTATGKAIRWADISAAMDAVCAEPGNTFTRRGQQRRKAAPKPGNTFTRAGQQSADLGNTPATNGQQLGNSRATLLRGPGNKDAPSTGNIPATPIRYRETKRIGETSSLPVQPKMRFDFDETTRASGYVDAIFPLFEAALCSRGEKVPIGKTEWKKRNMRCARDLAKQGISAERIIAAWKSACDRLGEPPFTMKMVQDELIRGAAKRAPTGTGNLRVFDGTEVLL